MIASVVPEAVESLKLLLERRITQYHKCIGKTIKRISVEDYGVVILFTDDTWLSCTLEYDDDAHYISGTTPILPMSLDHRHIEELVGKNWNRLETLQLAADKAAAIRDEEARLMVLANRYGYTLTKNSSLV